MTRRQPLPHIWLISDARNDAVLEAALARLPRGSGFVFRHYHLDSRARRFRFERLARIARVRKDIVILAGNTREACRWRAGGNYCAPAQAGRGIGTQGGRLRLLTAHSLREIGAANRLGADAVLLSPVFATRSHPGARPLGPLRFRLLAKRALAPVIALGGMDVRRAKRLRTTRWAAIDGLVPSPRRDRKPPASG